MTAQLTLYSDALGPNGWKVAMILNELNVNYKTIMVDVFGTGEGMNKDEYISKINPNGRIPAIVDHSANDFTLWESIAIIQYVAKKFDGKHALTYGDLQKDALVDQFLLFQASGQGPYFGQLTWFTIYHEEKNLTSVIERYRNEVNRVNGVLEGVLKKNDGWLTGEKCTVADLSFVIWLDVISNWSVAMGEGYELKKKTPLVSAWYEKMNEFPGVAAVRKEREAAKMRFK